MKDLTLADIGSVFNRAILFSFGKKKLTFTFLALFIAGLIAVFAGALAPQGGEWIAQSLVFLPIFINSALLLFVGVLLIRMYHNEVKRKDVPLQEVLLSSWELMVAGSYIIIPIILGYLLLWVLLGVFFLIKEIPGLGEFFAIIFAFVPFLISLGSILLCCLCLVLLHTLPPILALKGYNSLRIYSQIFLRIREDLFNHALLAILAFFPLVLAAAILSYAFAMANAACYTCNLLWFNSLQHFFIMVPYAACLTPFVIFFFNMSTEAYVLLTKNTLKST